MTLRDHQTLIREEFARQADAMSTAARFNDAGVLARMREAARLGPQSRVLDVIRFEHTVVLIVAVKRPS